MKSRKAKTITATMMVVCACGLLAYTLIATGGNLEPSAPPGPTMKTLDEIDPGISIPSLPYTISTSGSYYLTSDLTMASTTGNGITVNADNVTIDLRGYGLIGPGSGSGYNYGIYMSGRSNVEVRNGTVRGYGQRGITEVLSTGRGHRIIAVRAASNGQFGISLNGYGHLVKDCTAEGNGNSGIQASNGCTVTGNTAYNNQGAGIYATTGCTVTGNTAYNNQGAGIYATYGGTITGNTASNNGYHGIYAFLGSTVTGNTAYNNQGTGIYASDGCAVIGNTAFRNQYSGIWLDGNNLVDQNTAYDNNQAGSSYVNMDLTRTDCTYGVNHAP